MAPYALEVGIVLWLLLPAAASSRVLQGHTVHAQAAKVAPLKLPQVQSLILRQPSATHLDVAHTALRQPAPRSRGAEMAARPEMPNPGKLFVNVLLAASLLCSNLPAHAENELAAKAAQMSTAELVNPTCFATRCSVPMTKCIGDFDCIKGLTCSAKCSGDSECTVGCFARYNSPILEDVLRCTVEEAGCIDIATQERRPDTLEEAPRAPKKLVPATPAMLEGRWYKVMGFNRRYDCFDCQTNTFTAVDFTETPGTSADEGISKVSVEYTMPRQRIFDRRVGRPPTPIKSSVEENLFFDPANPRRTARTQGRMFGLTFWENWYVIGMNKPDEPEFRFIYYTGKTLESKYQGAFVYTREPELPPELVRSVGKIAREAGLDPEKACRIDNSCFTAPVSQDMQTPPSALEQFYNWLNDVRYTLRRYDLPELVEEVVRSPQPYQLYGTTDPDAGAPGAEPSVSSELSPEVLGSMGDEQYPGPAENEEGPRERVLSQLGGGLAGGIAGAVAGALDGGESGAKAGGIVGRVIGAGVGSTVGGVVGGTVGTVAGGVVGVFEVGSAVGDQGSGRAYDGVTAGTIFAGIDGATAGGIAGGTLGTIVGRVAGGNRLVRAASESLDLEDLPPLEDQPPTDGRPPPAERGKEARGEVAKPSGKGLSSLFARKEEKGGKKPKK